MQAPWEWFLWRYPRLTAERSTVANVARTIRSVEVACPFCFSFDKHASMCATPMSRTEHSPRVGKMFFELIGVDTHRRFSQRQSRVQFPLCPHKFLERYGHLRRAPLLICQTHPRLENLERFLLLHDSYEPIVSARRISVPIIGSERSKRCGFSDFVVDSISTQNPSLFASILAKREKGKPRTDSGYKFSLVHGGDNPRSRRNKPRSEKPKTLVRRSLDRTRLGGCLGISGSDSRKV